MGVYFRVGTLVLGLWGVSGKDEVILLGFGGDIVRAVSTCNLVSLGEIRACVDGVDDSAWYIA